MVTVSYFAYYKKKNWTPLGADAEKHFSKYEKSIKKSTTTNVQKISTAGHPFELGKARNRVQQDNQPQQQQNEKNESKKQLQKSSKVKETDSMKDIKEIIVLAIDFVENNNGLSNVKVVNKKTPEKKLSISSADDTDKKDPIILNNTAHVKYTSILKETKPTAFPIIKLTDTQKKSLVSRNLTTLQKVEGYNKIEAPRKRGRPAIYTQLHKDNLCHYVYTERLSVKDASIKAGYNNTTSAYNHLRAYREEVLEAGMDGLCKTFGSVKLSLSILFK